MRLLRHQGPQHGYQLGGGNVLQAHDLGDVFVIAAPPLVVAHRHRCRAGVFALYHPHYPAGADCGVTMHFQYGQEEIIELGARHRLGGHHLDLALDCRVHHDRGVGRLRHELDQLLNIGLFQVDREILGARDSRPQGSQQIKQRYSQCPQHGSH